ncbi:Co2+/Mg2+ efflux protein ApaG [Arachidicoccus sp.]|uniref:Co2+/Mg2+ efflux protein ApaG n=1 Tax=Arachidicoccus sp. TaxID=1872624 RepID=UPI003D1CE8F2
MTFQISQGIKINVETFYQPDQSNALQQEHLFAYRITIENHNTFTVRLLSRHWYIFDSNGTRQEVEGEGVIGAQPYIETEDSFQYVSGVNLASEMGRMHGEYTMENQATKQLFTVLIPAFDLMVPGKMN